MNPTKYARSAVVEVEELEELEESLETTGAEEELVAEDLRERGFLDDGGEIEQGEEDGDDLEAGAMLAEPEPDFETETETSLVADESSETDQNGLIVEEVSPEEALAIRLAARAASLSEARVRTICESLLFVADRPINTTTVQAATGIEPRRVRAAMEEISGRFREGVSGIVIHEVAGGWQFRSCPTSGEDLRRFLQVKPQRLTRAALETMAIVAYRQPVTRPEIEEIRGVDSGAVLKALLDRGLVQVLGKKEEPGRPLLYGTTRAFLEFFNLKDLASLPTLRELYELTEESTRIVEESFPEETDKNERSIKDLVEIALAVAVTDDRADDEVALESLDTAMKEAESAYRSAEKVLGSPDRSERNEEGQE